MWFELEEEEEEEEEEKVNIIIRLILKYRLDFTNNFNKSPCSSHLIYAVTHQTSRALAAAIVDTGMRGLVNFTFGPCK